VNDKPSRWEGVFFGYATSSFADVLRHSAPHLLPQGEEAPRETNSAPAVPHGTTVLALRYRDGVIMAGDRQASEGYQVASRRIEKIFRSDDLSGVGIAGAAGPAMEMARLFQTELEHYEKVEGENLSLDGKANKLGQMIRMNLPLAMQGLVVVPIFAGFDERAGVGRLFKYDVTGGRYEETDYFAQGSGGKDALQARPLEGRGGAGVHRGPDGRGRRGPGNGRTRSPAGNLSHRQDDYPLGLRRGLGRGDPPLLRGDPRRARA